MARQISKRERTKKMLVRILCGFLALLMVSGIAYYTIAFLLV